MIDLPPYQTWGRGSPQLLEMLAQWVPQRVKVEFFTYPPFQRPTPSTAAPMLYHLLGRSCCKKATVPYHPIRPQHFTGGKNQQPLV